MESLFEDSLLEWLDSTQFKRWRHGSLNDLHDYVIHFFPKPRKAAPWTYEVHVKIQKEKTITRKHFTTENKKIYFFSKNENQIEIKHEH